MAANGDVKITISADSAQGQAAIKTIVDGLKTMGVATKSAGDAAKSGSGGLDTFSASAKDVLKNVTAMVAAAVGIKDFFQLGTGALENALALRDLSQEVGISVESLSVLQLQAQKMGLDSLALSTALRGLSTSLGQVQQENLPTIAQFAALGLNAQELVKIAGGPGGMQEVFLKVANAITQFDNGANKNLITQELFGGRSTKLIALMQSLAGDGFDTATSAAERLGAIIREKDIEAAEAFQASILDLKLQTTALSQSFLEGLIPAITNAVKGFDDMTGSTAGSRESFTLFGEIVGKALTVVIQLINDTIGETEKLVNAVITIGKSLSLKDLASAAAQGPAVLTATIAGMFGPALEQIKGFNKQIDEDSTSLWDKLTGVPPDVGANATAARQKLISSLNDTVQALKAAGKNVPPIDVSTLSNDQIIAQTQKLGQQLAGQIKIINQENAKVIIANSDAITASLTDTVNLVKAKTDQIVAAATASFDQGKSSLADFFTARRTALVENGNAEIAAAQQTADAIQTKINAGSASGTLSRSDKIALEAQKQTALNDVTVKTVALNTSLNQLTDEEVAKRITLNNTYLDFQKAVADAQGNTFKSAILGVDQQVNNFKIQLAQIGLTGQAAATALAAFRDAAVGKATLDEIQKQADAVATRIANNQEELNNLVAAGALSQGEANQRQKDFVATQIDSVNGIINTLEAMKLKFTDPTVINAIQATIDKLNGIKTATAGALTSLQQLGANTLKQSVTSLTGFFGELTDGAHTFGQAVGDAALSFVKAITTMITNILVLEAVFDIAKALGVDPAILNAAGISKQFATGGIVPGQGIGDTVPAMLTPREYVLTEKMVHALGGYDVLETIRAGVGAFGPALRGGVSLFAGGGIVANPGMGAAFPGQDVTRVVVEVHPDAVVRQIETGPGSRAVIKAIQKNRTSARSAIGG